MVWVGAPPKKDQKTEKLSVIFLKTITTTKTWLQDYNWRLHAGDNCAWHNARQAPVRP